jgi:hypothetical protein
MLANKEDPEVNNETVFPTEYPEYPCLVHPCHHSMARPQVADRGTASSNGG